MRLIDADALIDHLRKDPLFCCVEQYGITGVIEAAPTIDENKFVTDYCVKRNLVLVALETFEKWQTRITRENWFNE